MSPRRAEAAIEGTAPLFAALGDATRLRIVSRLSAGGPMSITGLTDGVDVSRQAVTKHLEVLHDAGVVHDFRRGRERLWELDPERLEEAHRVLDMLSDRWDEALERLREMVEREA